MTSRLLGGGNRKTSHVHIFHATHQLLMQVELKMISIFDHLQEALDKIPPSEPYVMLGDFNACVGSRSPREDDHANGKEQRA